MTGASTQAHLGDGHVAPAQPRRFPPINEVAMASLALTVVGGIYLASSIPRQPSLAPAVALVIASGALLIWSVVATARLRDFAWYRFRQVGLRALGAYVVEAGILEYVFVYDRVRGGLLVVLTLMLVIFGVVVPLMIAFTSARYAEPVPPPT